MPALRSIAATAPRIVSRSVRPHVGLPALRRQLLHQDQNAAANSNRGGDGSAQGIDGLVGGSAKGRTGGGQRLGSSSKNAPPQPKITNQSVPGFDATDKLTEEQRREVEKHNREFEAKYDRGHEAPGDKVDKKF